MRLYDRRWSVDIDNKPFIEPLTDPKARPLQCSFKLEKEFGGVISYLELELYNLSNDSVAKLSPESTLSFSAGYKEQFGEIFGGTIVNVKPQRRGLDTITTVLCTAGGISRKKRPIVAEGFGVGTHVKEMIKACVSSMQYALVIDEDQFDASEKSQSSATLMGDPITILNKLSLEYDFLWAIEGQSVVVIKKGKTRKGDAVNISRTTGMVGVPMFDDVGYEVAVRINPKIRIGSKIKINSEFKNFQMGAQHFKEIPKTVGEGTYGVQKIIVTGDTSSEEWTMNLQGYTL